MATSDEFRRVSDAFKSGPLGTRKRSVPDMASALTVVGDEAHTESGHVQDSLAAAMAALRTSLLRSADNATATNHRATASNALSGKKESAEDRILLRELDRLRAEHVPSMRDFCGNTQVSLLLR